MRYYKHESEDNEGEGFIYQEVDEARDRVVRQVGIFGRKRETGWWNGQRLVGSICDQPASMLELTEQESISQDDFETVWIAAGGSSNTR